MTRCAVVRLAALGCVLVLVGCPKPTPDSTQPTSNPGPASTAAAEPGDSAPETEPEPDADPESEERLEPGYERQPVPPPYESDGIAHVTGLEVVARAPKYSSCSPPSGGVSYAEVWHDDPQCARLDKTWSEIPSSDRACNKATDCKVAEIYCAPLPMNAKALEKKKYAKFPCTPPAMGQCNPEATAPDLDCVQGCCVTAGGGSEAQQQSASESLRGRMNSAFGSCKVRVLDGPLTLRFTYLDGQSPWSSKQLSGFGDKASTCLQKVLGRTLRDKRSPTGYAFDVVMTVE